MRNCTKLVAAMAVVLACAASAHALSGSAADLADGAARRHPDPSLNLFSPSFNVYTGASMPAGWALVAELTSPFNNGTLWGTLYSQAWQYTDGHLLFAYQVENTGDEYESTTVIKEGNVAGWSPNWNIVDSGILDYRGDLDYDPDPDPAGGQPRDVLYLARFGGGTPQFYFRFSAIDKDTGGTVLKPLAPGENSSWFYMETDAPSWGVGPATVQDSGLSASPIPALIPIPEPLTALGVLLGAAGLARYIRKRRS